MLKTALPPELDPPIELDDFGLIDNRRWSRDAGLWLVACYLTLFLIRPWEVIAPAARGIPRRADLRPGHGFGGPAHGTPDPLEPAKPLGPGVRRRRGRVIDLRLATAVRLAGALSVLHGGRDVLPDAGRVPCAARPVLADHGLCGHACSSICRSRFGSTS